MFIPKAAPTTSDHDLNGVDIAKEFKYKIARVRRTNYFYSVHHIGQCNIIYGEVNSVKNTTINTWLNYGIY